MPSPMGKCLIYWEAFNHDLSHLPTMGGACKDHRIMDTRYSPSCGGVGGKGRRWTEWGMTVIIRLLQ